MLTFATEIPLASDTTMDDLVDLAKGWVVAGRYTAFTDGILAQPVIGPEHTYTAGHESLTLARSMTEDGSELGGLRYLKPQVRDSLEWTTTVVGHKSLTDFWVSVRIDVESTVPQSRLPQAKKPVIIKLLMSRFGGGYDGGLQVGPKVVYLGTGDIEFAASVINGQLGNRLPIVYISASHEGRMSINAERVSRELEGMAHVVVEPARWFSSRLAQEVNYSNVYGGNVAVYWPGAGRYIYRVDRMASAEIEDELIDHVYSALLNRRPQRICTWASLRESLSRRRLQHLKAEGSTQINEYMVAFDGEMAAKESQLETAEHEISRLMAEVRLLQSQTSNGLGGFLSPGAEHDLFVGERKDIVVEALAGALTRIPANTRRSHVIRDLIDHNELTGESEHIEAELRSIFKGGGRFGPKDRTALERLGFTFSDDGKHYKICYRGDERYTFTFARTPSDHRANLNFISDLKGKLL